MSSSVLYFFDEDMRGSSLEYRNGAGSMMVFTELLRPYTADTEYTCSTSPQHWSGFSFVMRQYNERWGPEERAAFQAQLPEHLRRVLLFCFFERVLVLRRDWKLLADACAQVGQELCSLQIARNWPVMANHWTDFALAIRTADAAPPAVDAAVGLLNSTAESNPFVRFIDDEDPDKSGAFFVEQVFTADLEAFQLGPAPTWWKGGERRP